MVIHEDLSKEISRSEALVASAAGSRSAFCLIEFPLLRQRLPVDEPAATQPRRLSAISKRALDLAVAGALLILLAPVLVAIALVVRFESAGPALFRQQRLGLNGKPFRILKFRTMHVLEDGEHVRQAVPNDERVTRVGRFLRAWSLDELPQFINVVKGEMSLVGPRPHAVAHDRQFGSLVTGYAQRSSVKPGITGWAQVNGLRGATPTIETIRRRVEHDVWYAQNASFLLDLRVLLRTPRELFRRRNAY